MRNKLNKSGQIQHQCGLINTESKLKNIVNALQLTQSMANIQWYFTMWGHIMGAPKVNINHIYFFHCFLYLDGKQSAEAAHTTMSAETPEEVPATQSPTAAEMRRSSSIEFKHVSKCDKINQYTLCFRETTGIKKPIYLLLRPL
jgi:hypothetical protein